MTTVNTVLLAWCYYVVLANDVFLIFHTKTCSMSNFLKLVKGTFVDETFHRGGGNITQGKLWSLIIYGQTSNKSFPFDILVNELPSRLHKMKCAISVNVHFLVRHPFNNNFPNNPCTVKKAVSLVSWSRH